MGRRAYKKVSVNGSVTLHQRYIYRGYLQIACIDLTRSHHPALWYITWDPSQPVATRPLAIRINGTWYTYGWDLTKNICELYSSSGTISTTYTYTPFGSVTASGSLTQPIQWSSEVWDRELGLVYYNWRYYNSVTSCWLSKDIFIAKNEYTFCKNSLTYDILGGNDEGYSMHQRYLKSKELFVPFHPNEKMCYYTHLYYEPDYLNKEMPLSVHPHIIMGVDEIKSYVNNINSTNFDKHGNKCWQIHIYPFVMTMQGISKLPWAGYEEAIILSHSEYHSPEISYYDTGISTGRYEDTIKILIGSQPNVKVFGCHLSGKVGGILYFYTDIVPMLKKYLSSFKPSECCEKTKYIQIVTTPQKQGDYIPLD